MSTTTIVDANGKLQGDKRQRSRLDYEVNWASWLTPLSDTIASASWSSSPGLTLTTPTKTDTITKVFVAGGVVNTVEWVTCQVTTVAGRVDERTIYLNILPR